MLWGMQQVESMSGRLLLPCWNKIADWLKGDLYSTHLKYFMATQSMMRPCHVKGPAVASAYFAPHLNKGYLLYESQ